MGVKGMLRTRPVARQILDVLSARKWVHSRVLASCIVGRDGEPLRPHALATTISRMRSVAHIEAGTFYRMQGTVAEEQWMDLELPATRRGRPRASAGRLLRRIEERLTLLTLAPHVYREAMIGQYVRIKVDPARRIFALIPAAATTAQGTLRERPNRKEMYLHASGLMEALRIPAETKSVAFDCKSRPGMLVCYPRDLKDPCEHCNGTGVEP